MKKKKLKLDQLQVESFTTTAAKSLKGGLLTFIGGGPFGGCNYSDNCEDEPVHSMHNGQAVFCKPPLETTDCGGN